MTKEEFIKELDGLPYEIEGGKVTVDFHERIYLGALTSIPPGVKFKNRGYINLKSVTSISNDVEFENEGVVLLDSLRSISTNVKFRNKGIVCLDSVTSISAGVEFNNDGTVFLNSLIGGMFNTWEGNIEGVRSNSLLNLMIKQGVFER